VWVILMTTHDTTDGSGAQFQRELASGRDDSATAVAARQFTLSLMSSGIISG
jgi:hypothetical protein